MSDRLNDLRRQRAALVDRMERMTDESAWTDAVSRKFNELESEARNLDAQIEAFEGVANRRNHLSQPAPELAVEGPTRTPGGKDYRSMFGAAGDTGGFSDPAEFFRTVSENPGDSRLLSLKREHRGMSEAIPSDGGFSAPVEMSKWLMDNSLGKELVRPLANVWPMASLELDIPAWDDSSRSSTLLGGFSAAWIQEGTAITESSPELRRLKLRAHKLGLLTSVTHELLADGLMFREKFLDALGTALAWELDEAFINGTGAGQPKGLTNDAGKLTVSAEVGQVASTFVFENATNMLARLAPECHGKAVWICNQTLIPSLAELHIDIGTAGSYVPALREDNGKWRLLGKPVLFSEHLPSIGTENDVILCDLSRYVIGLRSEIRIDSSPHYGFNQDLTYFRALVRADGQGAWESARTPKNGDSVSWIVSLETRS